MTARAVASAPQRVVGMEGVTVRYLERNRIVTALHDINLAVAAGQSVGIVGTKGSGKSTLIRMLSHLEKPLVGRVFSHGMTVSWPLWARQGMIRSLTVRDNIRFTAQLYGRPAPEIIRRVDDFVQLGGHIDLLLNRLPASTMSKVMFATAVAMEFDCYPIDDWVVSEDREYRSRAEETVKSLRRRSTLVLATNRASLVRSLCDVAYVLHRGVLTAHDTIDEAFRYFRRCQADTSAAEAGEAGA
ncbi:ATP-binding cassette domain-containing protein [Zavarzinia compransoris]|uniref:ATP-binding cassette domain-containing protein n=1 Tax=Zavarzinia marina TaxID=2911065 RepID=UPI001F1B7DCA|nr:ATP-binding cassette domain-containing protein [Zavarzinia marina]MCF4167271.1 ATP-binding cassette domain-containing protein [Zavarzinia marina]